MKLKRQWPQSRRHQRNSLLFPGHQGEGQTSQGCLADSEEIRHISLASHHWTRRGRCLLCRSPELHPLTRDHKDSKRLSLFFLVCEKKTIRTDCEVISDKRQDLPAYCWILFISVRTWIKKKKNMTMNKPWINQHFEEHVLKRKWKMHPQKTKYSSALPFVISPFISSFTSVWRPVNSLVTVLRTVATAGSL